MQYWVCHPTLPSIECAIWRPGRIESQDLISFHPPRSHSPQVYQGWAKGHQVLAYVNHAQQSDWRYTNREFPFRYVELGPLKTIDRSKAAISPHLKYFIIEVWFGNEVHIRARENDLSVAGTCQYFGIQGCKCCFKL